MLPPMFGMGGSEILVILIIALVFLGPEKLPDAARQLSKGIRDLKKQSRVLQQTIEDDEHIGGAIRDIKSALRGDLINEQLRAPVKKKKKKKLVDAAAVAAGLETGAAAIGDQAGVATGAAAIDDQAGAATGDQAGAATGAAIDVQAAAVAARWPIPASPVTWPAPADAGEPAHVAPSAAVPAAVVATIEAARDLSEPAPEAARPAITLPPTAGEADPDHPEQGTDDELAAMIRPASGTIAKGAPLTEPEHG